MGCSGSQQTLDDQNKKPQQPIDVNQSQDPNNPQMQNQANSEINNELASKFYSFIKENGYFHLKAEDIVKFGIESSKINSQEQYDNYFNNLMPNKIDYKPIMRYVLKESALLNEAVILEVETLQILINDIFILLLADQTSQSIMIEKKKVVEMFLRCSKTPNSALTNTSTLVDHIHNFIKTIFLYFFHYILFLSIVPKGVYGLKEFFHDAEVSLNGSEEYTINKDKILNLVKERFLAVNGKELNFTKAEEYCFKYIFSPINDCMYYII